MSTKSCHKSATPASSPAVSAAATSTVAAAPRFACPICEARSLLADAISAEVKAAAQVYHLANHWRSAHESRELSNFQAEDLSQDSLAQFAADTAKEADWYSQYQVAVGEHARLSAESAACRETYHQRLKAYTDTRKAKGCGCS